MVARLFSSEDQRRIEAAIERVESRSAVEVVVASVERCGEYWRGRVALAVCWAVGVAAALLHVPAIHPLWAILAQIPAGLLFYLLLGATPLLRLLIPPAAAERAVQEQALAMFSGRGLHRTRDHTGLLIFIAELERRVVILGDSGLHEQVGEAGWQAQVTQLIAKIREGRALEGMLEELQRIEVLAHERWPAREDDTNELPNTVITDARRA